MGGIVNPVRSGLAVATGFGARSRVSAPACCARVAGCGAAWGPRCSSWCGSYVAFPRALDGVEQRCGYGYPCLALRLQAGYFVSIAEGLVGAEQAFFGVFFVLKRDYARHLRLA